MAKWIVEFNGDVEVEAETEEEAIAEAYAVTNNGGLSVGAYAQRIPEVEDDEVASFAKLPDDAEVVGVAELAGKQIPSGNDKQGVGIEAEP
jgi:hypothetical protein